MKKASVEPLNVSLRGFPYHFYGELCCLLPLFAYFRQVCSHQRLSEQLLYSIAATSSLLILRVLYPIKLFANKVSAIDLLVISLAKFLKISPIAYTSSLRRSGRDYLQKISVIYEQISSVFNALNK